MVNFQNRKQGRTQRRRATDVLEKSRALTLASVVKQRGISNIPASASKAREKVPLVLSAGKRATGDKRGSVSPCFKRGKNARASRFGAWQRIKAVQFLTFILKKICSYSFLSHKSVCM